MTRLLAVPLAALTIALGAISAPVASAACGDGVREEPEQCDDGNTVAGDCCGADCTAEPDDEPCDDAAACTVDDACLAGHCQGVPGDPLCAPELRPLVCYDARPGGARFRARRGEHVADEFRPPGAPQPNLDVAAAKVVCRGGDAGRVGPTARTSFESYAARPSRGSRQFRGMVAVRAALGGMELKLGKPRRLLVPSGVIPGSGPAQLPVGSVVRRFTCYGATLKPRRGSAKADEFPPAAEIDLADPHGGAARYRIGRPTMFCAPEAPAETDENRPPFGHPGYLACHRAKRLAGTPAPGVTLVTTGNQFGGEVLRLKRAVEVCLPVVLVTAPETPAPRFPFEDDPSPTAGALRALVALGLAAPRTPEAAAEADGAHDAALANLRAHRAEAEALLLAALRALPASDERGHFALGPLLVALGDAPAILAHLRDLLTSPPGPEPEDPKATRPDAHTRLFVLRHVAAHARAGSADARAVILDAVGSPDPDVTGHAIAEYYGVSPSRWDAQAEMRQRLPAERRYQLYTE
jgi:cysteine-rich repeat protein